MKLQSGNTPPNFVLPAISGESFDLASLQGKPYLLSFLRFASCPFCNLRVHELVTRYPELGGGFTIVAVFDSPIDNLIRHAGRHQAPFPILADEGNRVHHRYGVEHSLAGVMKGMLLRLPTLLRGMFGKGYIPLVFKGSMTTMPADFLVDSTGRVHTAYYGRDEGDHLSFEQIKTFALSSRPGMSIAP